MAAAILVPIGITFALIVVFMVLERALRTDAAAATLNPSEDDRRTTRLVGAAFGASWFVLALSVPANFLHLGRLEPGVPFNIIGLAMMAAGIIIRVLAARTLGRFCSRTLFIREEHSVVSDGIYRRIRHPGYLGVLILFLGAGLSTSNWMAPAVIAIMIIPAYLRRMTVEEAMLAQALGGAYAQYMKKTRRLIPYIY